MYESSVVTRTAKSARDSTAARSDVGVDAESGEDGGDEGKGAADIVGARQQDEEKGEKSELCFARLFLAAGAREFYKARRPRGCLSRKSARIGAGRR